MRLSRLVLAHPLLPAVLAIAACQQADGDRADARATEPAPAGATGAAAPTSAKAAPAAARNAVDKTDLYNFEYSYPAAAAAIPGVRDALEEDLASRRAYLADIARETRKASRTDDFPFSPLDLEMGWDVVTENASWLSLSAAFSTYTGGAHPNHGFDAMLWDKRAGKLRDPLELFASDKAFVAAVQPEFCKALDRERAERREGEDMDGFDECVDPTETIVILGSSNHRTFDRIGFLIAPYIAGPYVEGSYEVTLPVTQAVLAKVKPEFRDSFSIGK